MNTIRFKSGNVRVIAHRGLSGIERENTAAAFVAAGNRSYDGIETDIHRTADGRFIVLHNDNLVDIAGENVRVEECSLAVSQSVVLFDKDGTKGRTDLRTPSLENYISICKRYEKHSVLELKSDFTEEEICAIVDIIEAQDYLVHVTFISFGYENLVKVRALRPEASVQFLFDQPTDDILARVRADRFDVDVYYKALTEDNIRAFHAAGCKINCWTVDDPADAERLVCWGVDMITSNILEGV